MQPIVFTEKLCKGKIAYQRIAKLQNLIKANPNENVHLRVTAEGRIGRTFLFLLRCLPDTAETWGKKLRVTVPRGTYEKLEKSGITAKGIVRMENQRPVIAYASEIVKKIPVQFSPRLHEDIVSRIGEILNNAAEHAAAETVMIGKYGKPHKIYCFTCFDSGVGIPNKVRDFVQRAEGSSRHMTDIDALKWALNTGNSTASSMSGPRGLGLTTLKEFARLNKGKIRICTGRVLYLYEWGKAKEDHIERFETLSSPFLGTLFEMDYVADDRFYHYEGENESGSNHKGE